MRIRVIHCDDDSHPLPWVKAEDCAHWSMTCPRSRKAKKPKHKLVRSEPGFLVATTGIPETGWPYDYDPPAYALELVTRRYIGGWHGPDHSHWVPAQPSNLVTCATGCGLKAAI